MSSPKAPLTHEVSLDWGTRDTPAVDSTQLLRHLCRLWHTHTQYCITQCSWSLHLVWEEGTVHGAFIWYGKKALLMEPSSGMGRRYCTWSLHLDMGRRHCTWSLHLVWEEGTARGAFIWHGKKALLVEPSSGMRRRLTSTHLSVGTLHHLSFVQTDLKGTHQI